MDQQTEYADAMLWVLVFDTIAMAGLVMVVCYGVWLAHKVADLMSEVTVLGERAGQLAELVAEIQPPRAGWELADSPGLLTVKAEPGARIST